MDYRSWLSLDLEQEQSGSYYMNVKVDDSELVNELRNSIKMSEMYDPEEIIDEAFEILTDDMMIEALKERETHVYERILNEVIPVDVIKEFAGQKLNFIQEKLKSTIDINETKKYLTETEQQMLLLLLIKAAKEQLN